MNSFKRWTIGICARFDDLLGQVENHEALAVEALSDMKRSLGRAHGQLSRVDKDCSHLKLEMRTAQEAARRWRTRASQETDDKNALECLRRERIAQHSATELAERLTEQEAMRDQVKRTISGLEHKYLDLKNKRQVLSTRQAAAEATEAVNRESLGGVELEDVFSRWEGKLAEREFEPCATSLSPDALEETYLKQEEEDSLMLELKALRNAPLPHVEEPS